MYENIDRAKPLPDPPPEKGHIQRAKQLRKYNNVWFCPPKLPFKELPEFLRKRIKIYREGEDKGCWGWTGEIKKGGQKYKPYHRSPEFGGDLCIPGRHVEERSVPVVRHPLLKKKVEAHRAVYSFATCVAMDDVPKLRRCDEPSCVNPHHVVPIGSTTAQRKRAEGHRPETLPAEPVEYTHERCMEMLRAASDGEGVATWLSKDEAADEAGIPRDQLTEATWAAYCREEYDE